MQTYRQANNENKKCKQTMSDTNRQTRKKKCKQTKVETDSRQTRYK